MHIAATLRDEVTSGRFIGVGLVGQLPKRCSWVPLRCRKVIHHRPPKLGNHGISGESVLCLVKNDYIGNGNASVFFLDKFYVSHLCMICFQHLPFPHTLVHQNNMGVLLKPCLITRSRHCSNSGCVGLGMREQGVWRFVSL